ncbi:MULTISPECIES: hypothetical protein [unclassified Flavobacterium]|uniref:hypothetical protein n=1 Tax=unclassified Flavobacterium TaxID=196869 RepID=UPI001F1324EC|nr:MULTISPECIES: hypothetical protein [unclassified Flavobacterium]UMY65037.1 hypothetical protein MKO97_10995 [Flavobacterium sp. HJ-32-4]
MIERIEKIENELNVAQYKFELLEQFFKSDTDKTESLILLSNTINDFMHETDRQIKDLKEAFALQSKYSQNLNEIIESHSRSLKTILEILNK